MDIQRNFAVIGGDMRIVSLANALYTANHNVTVYGICNNSCLKAPCTADLPQAVYNADILILPLPMLSPEGFISMPMCGEKIDLPSVLRLMNGTQILLGGKIPSSAKMLMDIHDIRYIDYFEREDLTVKNAMITAEGAVQTILTAYPKTLCSSKVLLLGFGRIGKFLTKMLSGFGADLTVAGRRDDTKAWVTSLGYKYAKINDEALYRSGFDIVINTVPQMVLGKNRLDALSADCLVLDLASAPGGTDFVYAKTIGLKALHALSLPGKTAPFSAGEAIKDTVLNICNSLEV